MCSHYQALKDQERMRKYFAAHPSAEVPADMWPRYMGVFIRRPPEWDSGDEAVPEREAATGRWGMIPPGTRPEKLAEASKKNTSNARSETAPQLWTFRNAWAKAQHCIIPADAIYEPDWRSGKAVPTRFTRADGAPLGIAGLWDRYRNAAGEWIDSYTMLTINADDDPLFRDYHQAGKEKRMVVILPDGAYGDWLTAPAADTRDFLLPYPADRLVAEAVK
ncbi:SOS response-associated peptidase [Bordetella bronchiseptica]|uniref:SOS response-associated peptidase n=1 Tax=Bordetella bronchiseptica TaxID=518 RepID=UPI000528E8F5|nr:SOS response-associated peptidase family protein [Bordetella bronchiseptica]